MLLRKYFPLQSIHYRIFMYECVGRVGDGFDIVFLILFSLCVRDSLKKNLEHKGELFQALQPGSNGLASLVRRILLGIMARSHGDLALLWPDAAELSCARRHRARIALNE